MAVFPEAAARTERRQPRNLETRSRKRSGTSPSTECPQGERLTFEAVVPEGPPQAVGAEQGVAVFDTTGAPFENPTNP